jgi:phenylacetic acid degradation protein
MLFEFDGKRPIVGSGCYIASSAEVIGDVVIGDGSYIGSGAKILGDFGRVRIGSGTAIEENVVVHARPNQECVIGNSVTVGHSSVLHDCVVGDYAVIGMGSVVSDFSTVGEWAAVGEGAVVVSGTSIPAHKVAVGVPAKPVKDISEKWKQLWTLYKTALPEVAGKFNLTLKEVKP